MIPAPKSLRIERGVLKGHSSGGQRADASRWKNPPHVALANLGYDPAKDDSVASDEEVLWFMRRYGSLGLSSDDVIVKENEPFELGLLIFRNYQRQLREAWRTRRVQGFLDPSNLKAGLGFEFMPADWALRGKRMELRVASCDWYMGILLARDLASGCAKICQNPACHSPYFVAERNDAIYCSHPCAVAVNNKKMLAARKNRRK